MKLSRIGSAALVIGTVAALSGCTSNQGNTGQSAEAVDASQETVRIGIDVPFHPIYDYLMANTDEFFGDTGYDVEFTVLDATTQVPSFGRGDLDVITTVPSFMPTIQEQYGIATQYFFPMARWTPGPQLLVAPDSPAQSIEDLAGQPVAIAPLSSRFGAEQAAVAAATGDTIQDYFQLSETDAAAQELTLGRVSAAFVEAPATAELLAAGYRPVFSVQEAFEQAFGDPAVMNGGFIASTDFVEANPDFVDALVSATQEAWTTFQDDPDTVLADASEVSGISTDQLALVAQVLNLADTTDEQKTVSEQDVQTWSEIFPLLEQSGFIQEAPADPASLFVVTGSEG
jgi:ABC-type nitrate/sulfonate/bicarbonate transport system substrate-binding protein